MSLVKENKLKKVDVNNNSNENNNNNQSNSNSKNSNNSKSSINGNKIQKMIEPTKKVTKKGYLDTEDAKATSVLKHHRAVMINEAPFGLRL